MNKIKNRARVDGSLMVSNWDDVERYWDKILGLDLVVAGDKRPEIKNKPRVALQEHSVRGYSRPQIKNRPRRVLTEYVVQPTVMTEL